MQDLQGLGANLMDFSTDEGLTEAEQLYVLGALLRTVKIGQCVLADTDTADLLTSCSKMSRHIKSNKMLRSDNERHFIQ
jgi:hypothetical protein